MTASGETRQVAERHETRQRVLVPPGGPIHSYTCGCGWQGVPSHDLAAAEAAALAHEAEA